MESENAMGLLPLGWSVTVLGLSGLSGAILGIKSGENGDAGGGSNSFVMQRCSM